ncbi:hypothetical protein ALC62_02285, partial [Cyphomyrmex costatus]
RSASDGGGSGSAPPTNHQGTTDDELARNRTYEIIVPFERRSCYVCLRENKGNFMALLLKDEEEHVKERHEELGVCYVCQKCGKEYKTRHPALCHVPKCTAPKTPLASGETCTTCGRVFATKSGLSQHERHEHPAVRNVARTNAAKKGEQAPRKLKTFTIEEVSRMLGMEVQYRGERNVAQLMAASLPGKTCKQIRDKRATLTYKKRRDAILAPREELEDVPEEDRELPTLPGDPPHPEVEEIASSVDASVRILDQQSGTCADASTLRTEASDPTPEAGWMGGMASKILEIELPDDIPANLLKTFTGKFLITVQNIYNQQI